MKIRAPYIASAMIMLTRCNANASCNRLVKLDDTNIDKGVEEILKYGDCVRSERKSIEGKWFRYGWHSKAL